MAPTEDERLVTLALHMALARRHPLAGLLHHSDRGSEYTSRGYQALVAEMDIEVRMSRTANCARLCGHGVVFRYAQERVRVSDALLHTISGVVVPV
jgi:transposase InsO family protein